ncbi:MAG TPA: DinB family protein [Candidatus Acidoferrales bacterium]|nr:DinB family protein [Candidatus Acidoferrales bacterium]
MTRQERRGKIESFGHAPAQLSLALRQFPRRMWRFKPSPERWSIHEIILHLADSEATCYLRCRRFIAEPGSDVLQYDPVRWAGSLGYFHQSTREALEIIRRLRRTTYQVLRTLPDSVWLHSVKHPVKGEITLADWLDLQERHIPHHIEHMKENYGAWLQKFPPRRSAAVRKNRGSARRMLPVAQIR